MSKRFRIMRHKRDLPTRTPWVLVDANRPHYLGHFATHDAAIHAIDDRLRAEAGLPPALTISTAEILGAMLERAEVRSSNIEPIFNPEPIEAPQ